MRIGIKRAVGRAVVSASIAAISLIAASGASAATFCVPAHSGCTPTPDGQNFNSLQSAFNAANMVAGKDTVDLGPTTLDAGVADVNNPVDVVGEGPGTSVIQMPGDQMTLLGLQAPTSTVTGLSIVLDGADQVGLRLTGTATNVEVGGTSTVNELGAQVFDDGSSPDGGIFRDGRVTLPTSGAASSSTAIEGLGNATVERVQVEAATGLIGTGSFRRLRVTGGARGADPGASNFTGQMRLDQVTVRLLDPAGVALDAAAGSAIFQSVFLTAQHVTAVGAGGGTGVDARGACSSSGPNGGSATVRNTILRGFATDLRRDGTSCFSGMGNQPAPANIGVAHSIFDPAKVNDVGGPGSITQGAGNINGDPIFVGATDFHLQLGSPAIDAGDPSPPAAGELDVDLDGNPRVFDGNGDGTARRDIGAFEFLPDSDGDGVPDLRDACPDVAAQTEDGCPAPDGGTGGDGTGPGITLGGKLKQNADGTIEVKVTSDEACTATGAGTVIAKAPSGGKDRSSARARRKSSR